MTINKPHSDSASTTGIVLNSRPKTFTRFITTSVTETGTPVIREIIIIQTEPSKVQLLSMIITFMIYGIIVHVFIALWERFHPKSCKKTLRFFLFGLPFLAMTYVRDYFFVVMYCFYAIIVGNVYVRIRQKPMRRMTPKLVYRSFKILTRICYASTVGTLIFMLIGFFGNMATILGISLSCLFYALYFGLLTRELSEFLCNQVAINTGYYSNEGVPSKKAAASICTICDETMEDTTLNLPCNHIFHEDCLKGWVFTGKKNFCPCCKENVDYNTIVTGKWEKGVNFYSGMLDGMRKGLVFLSVMGVVGVVFKLF